MSCQFELLCSFTGSREVKNRVVKIQNTLTSMRIDYEEVDVALDAKYLEDMRAKMNDHKAVVPQFFKDDQYLGVSLKDSVYF